MKVVLSREKFRAVSGRIRLTENLTTGYCKDTGGSTMKRTNQQVKRFLGYVDDRRHAGSKLSGMELLEEFCQKNLINADNLFAALVQKGIF